LLRRPAGSLARVRGPSCYGRVVIGGRAFLPASIRRRIARTVSSSNQTVALDVRRAVSEDTTIAGPLSRLRLWSFLLIVRTRRVVTSSLAVSCLRTGSAGFSDFPAYSRMLAPPSPAGRATKNLLLVTPIRTGSLSRTPAALPVRVGWLSGAGHFCRPLCVAT
jgi:hypothetical protein